MTPVEGYAPCPCCGRRQVPVLAGRLTRHRALLGVLVHQVGTVCEGSGQPATTTPDRQEQP